MSISIYTGTPGSGKSLHTARLILRRSALKNHPTIVNFECNVSDKRQKSDILYVRNDSLTPRFLVDYSLEYANRLGRRPNEDEILCIIDEAQMMFNCRGWNDKSRMDWIKFFTEHRHYGFRIILATQNDMMLDKQIRGCIEMQYDHRKLANMGKIGKIMSIPFRGKVFCVVEKWYQGGLYVDKEIFTYHKKYGRVYDTFKKWEEYA